MAELSCGGSCMKYILFFFNIIFFLCGGAILGVGIWAKVDDSFTDYIEFVNVDGSKAYFDAAVYMLIVIGAVIFLIGFLGCCGACTESSTMLFLYAFLLVLVVLLQIAAGVVAVVFTGELGDGLKTEMQKQVYYDVTNDTDNSAVSAAWFAVQVEFQCCGAGGFKDYDNSFYENSTGQPVPLTCCKLKNNDPTNPQPDDKDGCFREAEGEEDQKFDYLNNKGCYDEVVDWLEENANVLIAIAFAIAAIEIFGIVFACCVRSQINRKSY